MVQPLGKTVWWFLTRPNILLPYYYAPQHREKKIKFQVQKKWILVLYWGFSNAETDSVQVS